MAGNLGLLLQGPKEENSHWWTLGNAIKGKACHSLRESVYCLSIIKKTALFRPLTENLTSLLIKILLKYTGIEYFSMIICCRAGSLRLTAVLLILFCIIACTFTSEISIQLQGRDNPCATGVKEVQLQDGSKCKCQTCPPGGEQCVRPCVDGQYCDAGFQCHEGWCCPGGQQPPPPAPP